jgi:hypothetical protein
MKKRIYIILAIIITISASFTLKMSQTEGQQELTAIKKGENSNIGFVSEEVIK